MSSESREECCFELRTQNSELELKKEFFMLDYVWLIPLFPAIGFVINGFFGRRLGKTVVSVVGPSAIGLSFLTSILIFFELLGRPPLSDSSRR